MILFRLALTAGVGIFMPLAMPSQLQGIQLFPFKHIARQQAVTVHNQVTDTVTWTISPQPVAGTLTPTPAAGTICTGVNVSAALTAGTGGNGTVADVLQYSLDSGTWNNYTSGTNIPTAGHNPISIQTYRTATGSNCNQSVPIRLPGPLPQRLAHQRQLPLPRAQSQAASW